MSKKLITIDNLKTELESKLECLNPILYTKYTIKCDIGYVLISFFSKSSQCIEICEDYLRKTIIRNNIFDSSKIIFDNKTNIYYSKFCLKIEAFLNYKPTIINKMTIEN